VTGAGGGLVPRPGTGPWGGGGGERGGGAAGGKEEESRPDTGASVDSVGLASRELSKVFNSSGQVEPRSESVTSFFTTPEPTSPHSGLAPSQPFTFATVPISPSSEGDRTAGFDSNDTFELSPDPYSKQRTAYRILQVAPKALNPKP
jgi:hypothetical protein